MSMLPDDAFQSTKQPSAVQAETEAMLVDFVRSQGLAGYQAVLGAHAACWHQTVSGISALMARKIDEIFGDHPEGEVFRKRLMAAGVAADSIERARHDVLLHGECLLIADKCATCVEGINFLSVRKLEVSQIFRLAGALQAHEAEQAYESVIAVASTVSETLGVLASFENDLKTVAERRPDLPAISRQQIAGNAKYHPTVSHDWGVLAMAAEEKRHMPQAPSPPAPLMAVSKPKTPVLKS